MEDTKQQIAQAIMKFHGDGRHSFRLVHVCQVTGLEKQSVDYHLKKWLNYGLLERDPLNRWNYTVPDIKQFISHILSSDPEPAKLTEMESLKLDIPKLKFKSNLMVYLKAIDFEGWREERAKIIDELDGFIRECKVQKHYIANKRVKPESAAKKLESIGVWKVAETFKKTEDWAESLARSLSLVLQEEVPVEKPETPEEIEARLRRELQYQAQEIERQMKQTLVVERLKMEQERKAEHIAALEDKRETLLAYLTTLQNVGTDSGEFDRVQAEFEEVDDELNELRAE